MKDPVQLRMPQKNAENAWETVNHAKYANYSGAGWTTDASEVPHVAAVPMLQQADLDKIRWGGILQSHGLKLSGP